jgi:hypothetical protein
MIGRANWPVMVQPTLAKPPPRSDGMAGPQFNPMPLAETAYAMLPGRDPGAAELQQIGRIRERPGERAPARPGAGLDGDCAQAVGAENLPGGGTRETRSNDDYVVAGIQMLSRQF